MCVCVCVCVCVCISAVNRLKYLITINHMISIVNSMNQSIKFIFV